MKSLRIYNILTEDGSSLEDIILQIPADCDWMMIFDMVIERAGAEVDSYSYEEVV